MCPVQNITCVFWSPVVEAATPHPGPASPASLSGRHFDVTWFVLQGPWSLVPLSHQPPYPQWSDWAPSRVHKFSIGLRSQLWPTQSRTGISAWSESQALMERAVWQGAPSCMNTSQPVIFMLALSLQDGLVHVRVHFGIVLHKIQPPGPPITKGKPKSWASEDVLSPWWWSLDGIGTQMRTSRHEHPSAGNSSTIQCGSHLTRGHGPTSFQSSNDAQEPSQTGAPSEPGSGTASWLQCGRGGQAPGSFQVSSSSSSWSQ